MELVKQLNNIEKYIKYKGDSTKIINISKVSSEVGIEIDKLLSFLRKKLCLIALKEIIEENITIKDLQFSIDNFINDNSCKKCGISDQGNCNCQFIDYNIEEIDNIPEGDILISDYMKFIYGVKNTKKEYSDICDEILNECWKNKTDSIFDANKIINKFEKDLKAYGIEYKRND